MADDDKVEMPSEVSDQTGFFDRFAEKGSQIASRAVFFALCVALVIIWAPSYFLVKKMDTWQLIINTSTTIITFLMVALLQNSQTRTDLATQHKLNAIADGLADLMAHFTKGDDDESTLEDDRLELTKAVGLEEHESTSKNRKSASSNGSTNRRSANGTAPAKRTAKQAAAKKTTAKSASSSRKR